MERIGTGTDWRTIVGTGTDWRQLVQAQNQAAWRWHQRDCGAAASTSAARGGFGAAPAKLVNIEAVQLDTSREQLVDVRGLHLRPMHAPTAVSSLHTRLARVTWIKHGDADRCAMGHLLVSSRSVVRQLCEAKIILHMQEARSARHSHCENDAVRWRGWCQQLTTRMCRMFGFFAAVAAVAWAAPTRTTQINFIFGVALCRNILQLKRSKPSEIGRLDDLADRNSAENLTRWLVHSGSLLTVQLKSSHTSQVIRLVAMVPLEF